MSKFFKVKPEFDGLSLRYLVPDGRKKGGFRTEYIDLVGNELLPPKKWKQITNYYPERLDICEEVKVNPYDIYRSFGVLFCIGEASEYCGDSISLWRHLKAQFSVIYSAVTRRMPDSKFTNLMSIETLQFAIKYYNAKLPIITKAELTDIPDEIISFIAEDSTTNA